MSHHVAKHQSGGLQAGEVANANANATASDCLVACERCAWCWFPLGLFDWLVALAMVFGRLDCVSGWIGALLVDSVSVPRPTVLLHCC